MNNKKNKNILFRVFGVLRGPWFFVFLVGVLIVGCSKTPTNSDNTTQVTVNSAITQNTHWTSGTDYIIEGTVTVEKGVSLTITGNVTILFKADGEGEKGRLRVNGSLQAAGTDSTSPVLFKPYDDSQQDDAWGIELNQSEGCGVFEFCRFEGLTYGVNAFEASVRVNECTFVECVNGVVVSKCDSALIQGSEFLDNEYGIKTNLAPVGEDSVRVIGNVFSGAKEVGVEVGNYSKGVVENNYFVDCKTGMFNSNYSMSRVMYNEFEDCELCSNFYLNADGIIKRNNFNSGDIAIKIEQAKAVINYNNLLIYNTYILIYKCRLNITLNAQYNWWGSLNENEISSLIWDGLDSETDNWYSIVSFIPYLTTLLNNCGLNNTD